MPAPQVPTPGVTPAQGNPWERPGEGDGTRGMEGQEGERGLGVCCYDIKASVQPLTPLRRARL